MSGSRLGLSVLRDPLEYDGRQLRSHFVLERSGHYGDGALVFVGPCKVDLPEMVDLEDVRAKAPIYSPRMLHLLVEHFEIDLREGVFRQRLLVALAARLLRERAGVQPEVRGDDLYVADRKASVSIATRSPVSVVLHWGLNVDTEGTPVPTWGLSQTELDPADFGAELVRRYDGEIVDIHRAVSKVRGVP